MARQTQSPFAEIGGFDAREAGNGLAIDDWQTRRPENTLKALNSETDAPTSVLMCVIESSQLDIGGKTIQEAANSLEHDPDYYFSIPSNVRQIHLRNPGTLPLVGIQAAINGKPGLLDVSAPKQLKTGANVKRFTPRSTKLARMGSYLEAMSLAKRHGASVDTSDGWIEDDSTRTRNANETVKFYSRMFNLGMTNWVTEMGLPVIRRTYPVEQEDQFGLFEMSGVTIQELPHKAFDGKSYAKFSSPSTHPEAWPNMVQVTTYLETGKPAFDEEVAHILASHLHQRRLQQYLRNREASKTAKSDQAA